MAVTVTKHFLFNIQLSCMSVMAMIINLSIEGLVRLITNEKEIIKNFFGKVKRIFNATL